MVLQVSMHGHGLVLEKPDLGILTPYGGYARYSSSSGSVNWLHATFSLPIVDTPASLVQVGFRYRMYQPQPGNSAANQQAEITALHLYDGEKRWLATIFWRSTATIRTNGSAVTSMCPKRPASSTPWGFRLA